MTLIPAVSCDRDFVDSLASVMTEGSLTLCICSMWCWMRCPDIFRRWRAWQSHAPLLASQSAIFRLGLFLFIKKSEVRINGTDSQITSLVVLKQLEELSAQYDNDNQVYKGRYPVVKLAISQISAPEISFPTAARSTTRNPGMG